MSIKDTDKTLSADSISCNGEFKVTLSLTAEPEIQNNPTDIVLILDRSKSMEGSPLESLKTAAKEFVDIIEETTDGVKDGIIGGGSHIGIVSFASTATRDLELSTSVADLKDAIDDLTAQGSTNHSDAFTKAMAMFNPLSSNAKVMVMFTDGKTTAGVDASPIAALARSQGIVIYSIGLEGNGGIDVAALEDWASKPSSEFVAIAPSEEELLKIFEDLAASISKAGATGISITDTVNSCFEIVDIAKPNFGTASITSDTTLDWKIDKLGTKETETATLTFTLRHVGPCTGLIEVDDDIDYSDNENHKVSFPSPSIMVDCGIVIIPEECPTPVSVTVEGCHDSVEFDAGSIGMDSLGRIILIDVTIRKVCPHKRVALGVVLTELDENDVEFKRGLKTVTVPMHTFETCRDVTVKCIKFVLPEDLDVSGNTNGICNKRRFKVRFIANYIDNDFECCDFVI